MSESDKTALRVERYARESMKHRQDETALRSLMNVGPAVERDLHGLGIHTVPQLAAAEAGPLFHRLERQSGGRVDPCMYDTLCAIIHEARTGEKTAWFAWTAERKRLQRTGALVLHVDEIPAAAP